MNINKIFFSSLAFLLISTLALAQSKPTDNVSVGISYGANQILGRKIPFGKQVFSPRHIQVDARYFFRTGIGVSGHYAYSGFSQIKGNEAFGFHRFALEGMVSVAELLKWRSNFDFYAHAGGGLTFSSRENDKMITLMVGLAPEYRISERFAVKADISYINNRKQYNDYTGETLASNLRGTGNLMNYSVGLQYYFAERKRDAKRY